MYIEFNNKIKLMIVFYLLLFQFKIFDLIDYYPFKL